MEELADDAASVLDAWARAADVYGHSMGGFIALTLALRRPDLVRSLVLGTDRRAGPRAVATGDARDIWVSVSGCRARRRSARASQPPGHRRSSRRVRRVARRVLDAPAPPECWQAQFEASASKSASRSSGSTLVVHGDVDGVIPVSAGQLLADRMPTRSSSCCPARVTHRSSKSRPPSPRSSVTSSTASEPNRTWPRDSPATGLNRTRLGDSPSNRCAIFSTRAWLRPASASSRAVWARSGTPSSKRAAFASSAASSPRT